MAGANYTTLIAVWNTTTLPAGVTGAALVATDTDAQKLVKLNAWTVVGPAGKMIVPSYIVIGAIVESEYAVLTAAQQNYLELLLSCVTIDVSAGTNTRAALTSIFGSSTTTRANFAAIAATFDTTTIPWWEATVAQGGAGLASPISEADVLAAGLG